MNGYLVTGGTGFIGSALTLELLTKTTAPIHLLARGGVTAPARMEAALRNAASLYGYEPDFVHRCRERIEVIAGDLTDSTVIRRLPGDISEVWHCAASLKFDDASRAEIFGVNVDGTARLLDLSERLGVSRFNYMSTAYVVGSAFGRFTESPVSPDTVVNNAYESSKVAAEQLVLGRAAVPARIWRPGIVVGHSTTFAATGFSGFYGLVRGGFLIRKLARRELGRRAGGRHPRLLVHPDAEINLVPVDLVVRQAVELSTRPEFDAPIVHLTNAAAPRADDITAVIMSELGAPPVEFVGSRAELGPLERKLHDYMHFYTPHVLGTKTFVQDVAARYGSPISFPMDSRYVSDLVHWYVAHAGLGPTGYAA